METGLHRMPDINSGFDLTFNIKIFVGFCEQS